jgi:DNA-binding XRE family transcriptional regulator
MNEVDVKVGEIIRRRRKELGLTQTDLAEKVGSSKQCIYYYEKGTRGLTMSLFFKICDALHLDPNEIQEQVI